MKKQKIKELNKTGFFGIIEYKNSYVLIEKARGPFKGRWDLPGGKADFGETPEEALYREIEEETGLKIRSSVLYKAVSYVYKYKLNSGLRIKLYHTGIIYKCAAKNLRGLSDIGDGQDSLGAKTFTKKEISKLKLTPLAKMVLK
jgi:mutator protein MutT